MGKKSFDDGPAVTLQQATKMPCPWSGMDVVKDRLVKNQRLLEGIEKSPTKDVHPSLKNIEKNAAILRPLVEQMKSMKRMSAWPIEVYGVLCVAFYEGHKECYIGRPGNEGFNPESWGFQQAWTMHKMISALRTKAQRDAAAAELVSLLRDAKRLRLEELQIQNQLTYPNPPEGPEYADEDECCEDDDDDEVCNDPPDDVFEAYGLLGDTLVDGVPGVLDDAAGGHSEKETGPPVRVEASAAGREDVEVIPDSPDPATASSKRLKTHLLEGLRPHMLQMLLESAEQKMATASTYAPSAGSRERRTSTSSLEAAVSVDLGSPVQLDCPMVGNTPSPALLKDLKGSVNAGAADASNEDTLPASFEEMEAVAAAVSGALHRNPALKRNVWGDGVELEEPASRRHFPTEEAKAPDSPFPLARRTPEALESPFPLAQRTPPEALESPCRLPADPGSPSGDTPMPTVSPLEVTIRCEASSKPAKLKLSVAEAAEVAEVAEVVKAATKAVVEPCRQTRVQAQMGEVAAQAVVQAAVEAAVGAMAARAVARIRRAAKCRQSGMGSVDEAVDVPPAPVKVKSKGTKDGNSKTAQPKVEAKSKAKSKAKAKAKTQAKRGLEPSMEPSTEKLDDEERPESVHSPIRPRTLFKGCSPSKPIFNTPARRVKKDDRNAKGRGKGKKGKAANSKPSQPFASEYLRQNLDTLPNSFARRPIPSGVPALERYCRMVRSFQEQVEKELEPGMKCKAEYDFWNMVTEFKGSHPPIDSDDYRYIEQVRDVCNENLG
ncbi:unnamed protein product [Symbiodinium sp. CCMP2592]|nr:unnamed protein product [Symbiodinium sp. CCMP2592]